jgi:DNA repair ATPase RecN
MYEDNAGNEKTCLLGLGRRDECFIFDVIDSGVVGHSQPQRVGEKLSDLARGKQGSA